MAILVVVGIALFMLLAYSLGSSSPAQTVGSTGGTTYYAIVIDAGSSGSRVHAFKFNRNKGGSELDIDYFKQLKPGLSSYGDDAESAAKSLKPLLDYAVSNIPASRHQETPIIVRATAGLRMLPGEVHTERCHTCVVLTCATAAIAEHPERGVSVHSYQLCLQALGGRPCNNHGRGR